MTASEFHLIQALGLEVGCPGCHAPEFEACCDGGWVSHRPNGVAVYPHHWRVMAAARKKVPELYQRLMTEDVEEAYAENERFDRWLKAWRGYRPTRPWEK
jgi:hypothetical protein